MGRLRAGHAPPLQGFPEGLRPEAADEGKVCLYYPSAGYCHKLAPHPACGRSPSLRAKSRLRRLRSDTRLQGAAPRGRLYNGCSPFRVIHSSRLTNFWQHIVAVKVDFQRAFSVLVFHVDLAACHLFQGGFDLDGALRAVKLSFSFGGLAGLASFCTGPRSGAHSNSVRRPRRRPAVSARRWAGPAAPLRGRSSACPR